MLGRGWRALISLTVLIFVMAIDPPTLQELPFYRPARTALICIGLIWILLPRWRALRKPGASATLLLVFAFYQFASFIWSSEPAAALQGASYALLVFASVSIARGYSARDVTNCVIAGLLSSSVLGAVSAVALPAIGQETAAQLVGSWRGLAVQKNQFGTLNAYLALFAIAASTHTHGWSRLRLWLVAAFAVAMTILADSRGAQVVLLVGAPIFLLLFGSRNRIRTLMYASVAVITTCLVFLQIVDINDKSIVLYGFDINSSSRFFIWSFGFRDFDQYIVFGHGIGGFWTPFRAEMFRGTYGWVLPNFHNGYIAIVIETGVLGATLFSLFLVGAVYGVARSYVAIGGARTSLNATVALSFLIANLFEAHLAQSLNLISLLAFSYIIRGTLGKENGGGPHWPPPVTTRLPYQQIIAKTEAQSGLQQL